MRSADLSVRRSPEGVSLGPEERGPNARRRGRRGRCLNGGAGGREGV